LQDKAVQLAGQFGPFFLVGVRVVIILAGAVLASFLLKRVVRSLRLYVTRALQGRRDQSDFELEKQASTVASILSKTASVLVYCFAVVMALREFGFDVTPMIAGAGVVGIAFGFGAQNLVKDVISGFFLLVENHVRVNDVVVINDVGGAVEEINLRTTVLRDLEGTIHVFPNGSITKLANKTQGFSYYLFSLFIAWRDDTDLVLKLLQEVCEDVVRESPYQAAILSPLEILGVDQLAESHVILKARIKTLPGRQWEVGREINRRLKPRLESAGLDLPVRGPKRVEIMSNNYTREDFKTIVREVLDELDQPNGAKRSKT